MPMRLNPCLYKSSSPGEKRAECNAHMTNTRKYRLNVQTWKSPCNWIDYTIRKEDCPSQNLTKMAIMRLSRGLIFFCERFVIESLSTLCRLKRGSSDARCFAALSMTVRSLNCAVSNEGHLTPLKLYNKVWPASRWQYCPVHCIPATKTLYYGK